MSGAWDTFQGAWCVWRWSTVERITSPTCYDKRPHTSPREACPPCDTHYSGGNLLPRPASPSPNREKCWAGPVRGNPYRRFLSNLHRIRVPYRPSAQPRSQQLGSPVSAHRLFSRAPVEATVVAAPSPPGRSPPWLTTAKAAANTTAAPTPNTAGDGPPSPAGATTAAALGACR
jgi:hypothetical protein